MAVVQILGAIVGIAAAGGWFAKTEFADEILGEWGDRGDESGGLVAQLEEQTGKIYPRLREMRKDAIRAFSKYRNALPWNKGSTASSYQARVRELADAIKREAEAYQAEVSVTGQLATLGGVITSPDWWKKYLPWFGIGLTVLILGIVLTRRK